VAAAIRHWDFHGLFVKQFWACPTPWQPSPLTGATIARLHAGLFHLVARCRRDRVPPLGGWVAGFFASSISMDATFLFGGSELCSSPCSLLVSRSPQTRCGLPRCSRLSHCRQAAGNFRPNRYRTGSAVKRDYRRLVPAVVIGVVVGVLYALPLAKLRDPWRPFTAITTRVAGRLALRFSFYAIFKDIQRTLRLGPISPELWMDFFVLIAVVVMIRSKDFRAYARAHPVEVLFLAPYILSLYTYNYPHWARQLPALLIPFCRSC